MIHKPRHCTGQLSNVTVKWVALLLHIREVPGLNLEPSKVFSTPQRPDRLWGPPSLMSSGYRGYFARAKWPGREVDRSPPSSAEVKNSGTVPPLYMA
jgi:hypothetical protein